MLKPESLSYVIPLLCLSFTRAAAGEPFTVVKDGTPQTTIRKADDASPEITFAAERLQHYIKQISGATLPIRKGTGPGIILTVDPALRSELTEDGFVILSDVDRIEMIGARPLATVYAVYTLLEEELDCRWFTAEPIGEDLPRKKTLTLPVGEKRYRPSFRFRSVGGVGNQEWALQNRMSEHVRVGHQTCGKVWGVAHTFYKLLPPEEHFNEHPEWFALVDGQRRGPIKKPVYGPQICTSNPEAIRAVADRINRMFDENPELQMITLGPNDGRHMWCECKNCQAQDDPGKEWTGQDERLSWRGQLSRRVMTFDNAVARLVRAKHPDKLIKIMMYCWYQEPPTDPTLRFEDNICVMLTHSGNPSNFESLWPSCYNHPLTNPKCRPNQERFVPALKSWQQRSKQLGVYEYYVKGSVCETLFPILHSIRKDIPYYHAQGATYFHTQGRWYSGTVSSLNLYVAARLMWDVKTDVDALLNDFYRRYYREARQPMRAYHEMLERRMQERGGDVLGWLFHLPRVYDDRTVDSLTQLLNQAEAKAATNTVRKRIARTRMELEYTVLATRLWAELEAGYHALKQDENRNWTSEQTQQLAERIDPYQSSLLEYCKSHEPMQYIPKLNSGYVNALFKPGLARIYPTLLPCPEQTP